MDEEPLKTCLGCGVVSHPYSWCEYCIGDNDGSSPEVEVYSEN